MRYPDVEEGVSCDKCAFKARNKAFLFVGQNENSYNVMLKLGDSLAEAGGLAAKEPDCYKVGGHGWVTLTLPNEQSPPQGLVERWVEESFRLLAPKQLVARLGDGGPMAASKPAKKVSQKKGPQPKKPGKKKAAAR
jgi:hypothetical protein